MNNKSDPTTLTAAECACRTGVTVRALRVYEEMGLISPQRSAGGWRCYGERELIRLNTITLLKSAGLTLAQIRTATHLNEQDPSLQHVLELQVDAWKAKQADAARGQAIVEMALKSLKDQHSVSIDDLCNLVRSLESSNSPELASNAGSSSGHDAHRLELDIALLDRYVGFYRYGEFSGLTVTRVGNRLFGQLPDQPVRELVALSDSEFLTETGVAHARFIAADQGPAHSVIIYQAGFRVAATRVDAASVAAMQASLAAKIQSQVPTPGSEAALHRVLAGIASGLPNYDEMSPILAQQVRHQLAQMQTIYNYLGPVVSVKFQGVGNQGWDVYDVQRESGSGQWRIIVNANGIIEGAGIQVADPGFFMRSQSFDKAILMADGTCADGPAPGSEAALRRMIDGIRSGHPNYQEMSPLLAQAIQQQMPILQSIGNRLGGMRAVEFKGAVTRRFDIFELQRENGSAQWRIALAGDGTIVEASAMVTGSSLAAGP